MHQIVRLERHESHESKLQGGLEVLAKQARNYRGMSIILSFLLFLLFGSNLAWAQSSEQKFSFSAEA
jgi:hypothetical protein